MAIVKPFRGVLYNKEHVGMWDNVVAPPYDVISPSDQQWYYNKHEYNAVRLILPIEDQSSGSMEKYESSSNTLNSWIKDDILVTDEYPAIYVIKQEYVIDGVKRQRIGFTCAVKLESYDQGTVKPHENILAKPMDDRLNMLRYTKSNYDSVFGLYTDDIVQSILNDKIAEKPKISAKDKDGVLCELWKITDESTLKQISESMSDKSILIADGHHRYAAALAYRDEMRKSNGATDPEAPYEYVMMTLVSLDDSGLIILPTHRMVRNIQYLDIKSFIDKLSVNFEIKDSTAETLMNDVDCLFDIGHAYGLYIDGKAFTLKLKSDLDVSKLIDINGSASLKNLDVTILHSLILENFLGIGMQQMSKQSNLSYTRSANEAIDLVNSGEYQMSFLMNPTRISEVKAITELGEKMPQKSTFFYPKLLTGMVIRNMR